MVDLVWDMLRVSCFHTSQWIVRKVLGSGFLGLEFGSRACHMVWGITYTEVVDDPFEQKMSPEEHILHEQRSYWSRTES